MQDPLAVSLHEPMDQRLTDTTRRDDLHPPIVVHA
jgi:hypothetical protein